MVRVAYTSCGIKVILPNSGNPASEPILLASELIKCYSRKNSSPRCMIKVDLKKAYDSLEWPFLNVA